MPQKNTKKGLLNYDIVMYLEAYNSYPILLVHDKKDSIINVNRIQVLLSKIEYSQVFLGTFGGHFKLYKHPEVIQAIQQFIKD